MISKKGRRVSFLKAWQEKGITALMPPNNTQLTPAPPPVEDYQVSGPLKITVVLLFHECVARGKHVLMGKSVQVPSFLQRKQKAKGVSQTKKERRTEGLKRFG